MNGNIEIKDLCHNLSNFFYMSWPTTSVLTKSLKRGCKHNKVGIFVIKLSSKLIHTHSNGFLKNFECRLAYCFQEEEKPTSHPAEEQEDEGALKMVQRE